MAILLMATFATASLANPLSDMSGNPKEIKDFIEQGKWLVVMIWASDCHVCNAEAHNYVAFHELHHDIDAKVLGITVDGEDNKGAAEAFIKRHKLNFPNLIAEGAQVAELYTDLTGVNLAGTPAFLIYGPEGNLQAQQVGAVPTDLIEDFMQQ